MQSPPAVLADIGCHVSFVVRVQRPGRIQAARRSGVETVDRFSGGEPFGVGFDGADLGVLFGVDSELLVYRFVKRRVVCDCGYARVGISDPDVEPVVSRPKSQIGL